MVKLKYRPRTSTVNRTTGQRKLKYNIDKFQNIKTAWEYKVIANEELDEVCMDGDRNVNSWWKKIKENIQTSAEKVLGFEEQKKQPSQFDDECEEKITIRKEARNKMLERTTSRTLED
jgi:hypothetical protein